MLQCVVENLKDHRNEAARLDSTVQQLPFDTESHILGAYIAGIKTRIVTLLAQAEQGTIAIQVSYNYFNQLFNSALNFVFVFYINMVYMFKSKI